MHPIAVHISNRHIHLTQTDVNRLFGAGYVLTKKVNLLQPGAFAAEECVTIAGPKSAIESVRIVGPLRPETQCEILLGDTYRLGINAPIRLSGDITDTPSFTITGPAGTIEKTTGIIVAKRHIHLDPVTAEKYQVSEGQSVTLRLESEQRTTEYKDTIIRIHPNFLPECHIDTEEANAAGIKNAHPGEIIT